VPFLARQLRPAEAPDPKHLARLIADLDADDFAVREKATRELGELGALARPAVRQALAGKPSVEARGRLERPEGRGGSALGAEELRAWRAVEVLERLGTPEARQVLEKLAKGAAEVRQTEDAQAALQRLAGRPARSP